MSAPTFTQDISMPTTVPADACPQYVPPGHFFSPIPLLSEALTAHERLSPPRRTLPGITLDLDRQMSLVRTLEQYYRDQPFSEERSPTRRYYLNNPAYCYADGLFLHFMIRYLRLRRIIEVGSGYSSCAILDTNELFFSNKIRCTFIDPYPELLLSLIWPEDRNRIEVLDRRVQDVPVELFRELSARDILFIDSSHVSRIGSDVNHLVFEVLPALASDVYIHFHDIFPNFEYPREWIIEGRSWNEAYLLRAFLQFNPVFEIILHLPYVEHFMADYFHNCMPLCMRNTGGSLWIRRQ